MRETGSTERPRARQADLISQEVQGELLVYDLIRHQAHSLNRIAQTLWKHCDGQRTVADIAKALQGRLETPVDENVVSMGLRDLHAVHLLETAPDDLAPPSATSGFSRREMIAAVGLAAVALPVIHSIVAPRAAEARTCQTNKDCEPAPVTSDCICTGQTHPKSCRQGGQGDDPGAPC
ncbi:MAG: PqqD family protein [Gemmatimonadetes bacterium]|nr:PqqD family protein [Gemmatimonadota bacterium]